MAESPYPPYVPLRTIVAGRGLALETTRPLRLETTTTASRTLVWRETGEPFFPAGEARTPPTGEEAVLEVPRTDLTGWVDQATGDSVDPALGPTHTYTTHVRVMDGDRLVTEYDVSDYQVPSGAGVLDLDLLRFSGLAPSPSEAPQLWNLTGGGDFPPAAKVGDWGIDLEPVTYPDGSVKLLTYRKA